MGHGRFAYPLLLLIGLIEIQEGIFSLRDLQ